MHTTLPKDLIRTAQTTISLPTTGDTADLSLERSIILQKFWKIHTLKYGLSKSPFDGRGENLFWRVWGIRHLRDTISPELLSALWQACYEPIILEPTTTTKQPCELVQEVAFHPSDIADRPCSSYTDLVATNSTSSQDTVEIKPQKQIEDLHLVNSSEALSHYSFDRRYAPRRPLNVRTQSSVSLSRDKAHPGQDRLGAAVVATPKPKRPVAGRRKSSANASRIARTPRSAQRPEGSQWREKESQMMSMTQRDKDLKPGAAASSWEDEAAISSSSHIDDTSKVSQAEVAFSVDRNFRDKFAKRIASPPQPSYSIPLLQSDGMMPSPGHRESSSPEEEKDTNSGDSEYSCKPKPILVGRYSTNSAALSDVSGANGRLPRPSLGPSRLSFLISEQRASRCNTEDYLPHDPTLQRTEPHKSVEAVELLAMARSQGVTKAGGNQIPPRQRVDTSTIIAYSPPEQHIVF